MKSPSNSQAPFAEHWDGTEWKIVPVPDTGLSSSSFLFGASPAGADEVWATGYTDLALRWDGSNWISTPVANTNGNLNGVVVFRNGQAWAVGYQSPGHGSPESSVSQLGDPLCRGRDVYYTRHRSEWLEKIPEAGARRRAEQLYQQLDMPQHLREQARRELLAESRKQ